MTPFDFEKDSFPAFTVCEIGNATHDDRQLGCTSLEDFTFPIFIVPTNLGRWCRIINFDDQKHFLPDVVGGDRIFKYTFTWFDDNVPANETRPYRTTSAELGVDAVVYHDNEPKVRGNNPFLFMIHSPFELPTVETQKFLMVDMDDDRFLVTPQLNKIDDTMIGMSTRSNGFPKLNGSKTTKETSRSFTVSHSLKR